jgi:hypothetical protein
MAILAKARAAIDASRGKPNELPDPERERRVAIYARQVATSGRITAWLPPSDVREAYLASRSRFVGGDALRRRG